METDIGEIPIHYFLSTYELVKKSVPASFVLTMLNGGYLTFYHDAEAVSQILRIPLYAQAVLNHSKPVPYCFIPIDGFGESLDTIMDVQGSGVVLTDRNPGNGIETLSISPAQVQLSLFS